MTKYVQRCVNMGIAMGRTVDYGAHVHSFCQTVSKTLIQIHA